MTSITIRPSTSRTGTPIASSSQTKHTISLEDWEAKAPLSDNELRSIAIFQKACEKKPLPYDTSVADGAAGQAPLTLQKRLLDSYPSRPGTPQPNSNLDSPSSSQKLYPKRPIQTTQEFYDWFGIIERSVAHSQEAHYREHLATVEKHLSTCKGLAEDINNVESDVDGMLDSWRSVESGGRSLKEASEQLLEERDRLIRLAEDVSARLEYFQELEHATRMLNHPGDSLVLQADFLEMVERVDICIDFLRSHRHYREAEVYLLRYQQCLTRAMTLIKMYFVGSLKALVTDISKRVPDKGVSATAQMHLLYTRFQTVAAQVGPLIAELERRTRSHPEELSSLLSDCHTAYFSTRKTLLIGRLSEEIKGLDPNKADLVELTRAGCSYLKQLCMDEFAIYRCFFNSGKESLYAYLESLCDYLYDDLRPRILHEPRLTVLCDVCKVLQALMVLDVPEDDSSSDDDDDIPKLDLNSARSVRVDHGLGRLHISHMLQSVLQDAQTRLFFKAQTVVQSDIRYYVPRPEDIDYPKIIEDALRRTRAPSTNYSGFNIPDEDNPLSKIFTYNRRETWYTTLRTTVSVLLQLREFVQPSIFEDIALEAIDFCRINLSTASNMILSRDTPSPKSEIHAELFLIRHLLILKEISSALNLSSRDGSDGPIELRHVTETLRDMLRTTNLVPYAFGGGGGAGLVKAKTKEGGYKTSSGSGSGFGSNATGASVREKKGELDADLKLACEIAIQAFAATATEPIDKFMFGLSSGSSNFTTTTGAAATVNAPANTASKDDSSGKISKQESTGGDRDVKTNTPTKKDALEVERAFQTGLEREVPAIIRWLRLYLADGYEPPQSQGSDEVNPSSYSANISSNDVSGSTAAGMGMGTGVVRSVKNDDVGTSGTSRNDRVGSGLKSSYSTGGHPPNSPSNTTAASASASATINSSTTIPSSTSMNSGMGTVSVLLGHIQERVVDTYVMFRRAVEFLPADTDNADDSTSTAAAAAGGNDAGDADGDNERDVSQGRKTFSTPEEIRTLFRALT